MANNAVKWQGAWESRGNVLDSELDSLTDGSRTDVGTEVDNSVNHDEFGQVEINVTFATGPTGNLKLYMVTAPDGTNYENGSSSVAPAPRTLVDVIKPQNSTSAQRLMSKIINLLPAKTKFLLLNDSGQSFPASGSTIELFPIIWKFNNV